MTRWHEKDETGKLTDKVMTVGAVLVVVLGLAMVSQGGSLSVCGVSKARPGC